MNKLAAIALLACPLVLGCQTSGSGPAGSQFSIIDETGFLEPSDTREFVLNASFNLEGCIPAIDNIAGVDFAGGDSPYGRPSTSGYAYIGPYADSTAIKKQIVRILKTGCADDDADDAK